MAHGNGLKQPKNKIEMRPASIYTLHMNQNQANITKCKLS